MFFYGLLVLLIKNLTYTGNVVQENVFWMQLRWIRFLCRWDKLNFCTSCVGTTNETNSLTLTGLLLRTYKISIFYLPKTLTLRNNITFSEILSIKMMMKFTFGISIFHRYLSLQECEELNHFQELLTHVLHLHGCIYLLPFCIQSEVKIK